MFIFSPLVELNNIAGEIDDQQHKFVTNLEKTHAAVPKALYKTHKVDADGNMLDPIPIRNLTVGIATPVHAQSKLCQIGIQYRAVDKQD